MTSAQHLKELERKLPDLTLEEFKEAIRIRKMHAHFLQPKIRKIAMKKVHHLESLLGKKRAQSDGSFE
jgi:hypothetical protein